MMKILLAEDSRAIAAFTQMRLAVHGHEVVLAHNGQIAVEMFGTAQPDLILMDMDMPVMDGVEATRRIRSLQKEDALWVPIIFLTSLEGDDRLVEAIDAGGDDYLFKPVAEKVLLAKIKSQQRQSALRQSLLRANNEITLLAEKHAAAEAALRESESRQVHAVLQASPDGMMLVGKDGVIRFANARVKAMFDYPALVGLHVEQLMPQDSRSQHRRHRTSFAAHPAGRPMAAERSLRALRHDGTSFPVEIGLSPFVLEGEQMVIASLSDITQRVAAVDQLAKREIMLRKAQEIAGLGSYTIDLITGCWERSAQLDAIFGTAEHGVFDMASWNALIDPAYRQTVLEHYLDAAAQRREFRIDYPLLRSNDGERRWVAANGELEYDSAGMPVRLVGTIQDITERRQIQESLQQSHDLLDKLASEVPGVLYQFRMSADGKFAAPFASHGVREMFNLTPAEVREDAAGVFAAVHPADLPAFVESVLDSARTLQIWLHQFRVVLPGGTFWRFGQARPERQADDSILWHGFVTDISDRVRTENQLRELNETLEERVDHRTLELEQALHHAETAKRSRGEFLANMSHEIRTPMNAVLGMAYLALRGNPAAEQRGYLEKIQQSGEHLLGIINDILDFSKIDAGKMDLENDDFDLDRVIQNVAHLTEGKAREKGLSLYSDIESGIPRQLRGDALRLGQILVNYINNAIKFTEQGSVSLRVRQLADDPASADCVHLRFEVEDTGIGLSEAQQSRLFRSFEQADSSTTRKFGGTGLGLAICKQLAGMMGGDVGVASLPGRGSTFWFTARLAPGSGLTGAGHAADTAAAMTAVMGQYLLVVDDNPFNLEVAKGMLEDAGGLVALASDGAEALSLLGKCRFAAVLMDMHMPVMDGLEATQQIRRDAGMADTPVIGLTANAGREDHQRCLDAGMNDVVTKPIDPDHLFATLAKWLTAHPREAAAAAPLAGPPELPAPRTNADIDFAVLRGLAKNDSEKMRKFARLFLQSADQSMAEIDAGLRSGDLYTVRNASHRVKSSARSVGATGFADFCQAIEDLATQGSMAPAEDLLHEMRAILARIRRQIMQEVGES